MPQGIQDIPIRTHDPQSKWSKPLLAGTAVLVAGGAVLALDNPVIVGVVVACGVNVLSSLAINKMIGSNDTFKTQFLRLCASVAAVALAVFALPYAATLLGSHSFFYLSQEMVLAVGIADIVIKIGVFTARLIGNWVVGSFRFPTSEDGIQNLSKDKLKQAQKSFEEKPNNFETLPLNLQVAFNKQLVDAEQHPLPLAYTELEGPWSPESLEYLGKIDLSSFTVEQQKKANTLLFSHSIPPQKSSPTTADALPEFDPKGAFSKGQAQWVRLHYALTEETVPKAVATALQKAQLPPVGDEVAALKTPKKIEALSSSDILWHYNNFKGNPGTWHVLSSAQKEAFRTQFSEKSLDLSKLPKFYHKMIRGVSPHITLSNAFKTAHFALTVFTALHPWRFYHPPWPPTLFPV